MNRYFKKLSLPYLIFLIIFAILPMLFMTVLSFMDNEGTDFTDAVFTVSNFEQFAYKSTLVAFGNSLLYSFVTTLICAVLGYLVAYKIWRSHFKNKFLITTLLVLPMWSNILLRVNALEGILEPHNILTSIFSKMGWNITFKMIAGTPFAVILGLCATYLPLMILTIYSALEKVEKQYEEASLDLGLTPLVTFWKVILPLSSKGIVTGAIMVFLPCMSGFAIPEILGQGNVVLIGNVINDAFKNMNYNVGSLLAIVILIFILGAILIVNKVDEDGEGII